MPYEQFDLDDGPQENEELGDKVHKLFDNFSGHPNMGLFRQFLQLLWKNLILRKRQKVGLN
jgi:hypothetical protein